MGLVKYDIFRIKYAKWKEFVRDRNTHDRILFNLLSEKITKCHKFELNK